MPEKPEAAQAAPTPVETVIIGAGPVGLFQIFELGLLGISAHVIDSLAQAGGQCTELYPDKPIYDIPSLPICGAQELIDRLLERGFKVFLDLKLHDIPNTVAGAVRSVAGTQASLLTIHAGGGEQMMRAAAQAATAPNAPQLLAVTVLTSMDAAELTAVGVTDAPSVQVLRLAQLAKISGITGLVCSRTPGSALR